MKDFLFKHNLENKLMEQLSLIQSTKSLIELLIQAEENSSDDEVKRLIDSLILVNINNETLLYNQKIIIDEFQQTYCIPNEDNEDDSK